jgi:hypothetical protein
MTRIVLRKKSHIFVTTMIKKINVVITIKENFLFYFRFLPEAIKTQLLEHFRMYSDALCLQWSILLSPLIFCVVQQEVIVCCIQFVVSNIKPTRHRPVFAKM